MLEGEAQQQYDATRATVAPPSSLTAAEEEEEIESKGREEEERKTPKKREKEASSSPSSSTSLPSSTTTAASSSASEEEASGKGETGIINDNIRIDSHEWPKEKEELIEEEEGEQEEEGKGSGREVQGESILERRVIDLEAELERRDVLVDRLARELESTKEAHAASEAELQQVTHTLLPLAESLHKMQQQLDERDQREAQDRAAIEEQFTRLLEQLEAARDALRAKDEEVHRLQNENQHLKGEIERRLREKGVESLPMSVDSDGETTDGTKSIDSSSDRVPSRLVENGIDRHESDGGEDDEQDEEETIGEAAGPPVRPVDDSAAASVEPSYKPDDAKVAAADDEEAKVSEPGEDAQGSTGSDDEEDSKTAARKSSDPLDHFKEDLEREFKRINDSFQSAEKFSEMFSRKTLELTSNIIRIKEVRELEKEKVKLEQSLSKADGATESSDDGFNQKVKSWPREMVEKQLIHYRVR